ncbi:MAG TPA: ATPase, T2SS/T4P/T4SS family, partial [Bryobacteraceae bacterium]|nr:ATPase, T2SS/T4P/T4SS family [Bryobacteraceae bacterium]
MATDPKTPENPPPAKRPSLAQLMASKAAATAGKSPRGAANTRRPARGSGERERASAAQAAIRSTDRYFELKSEIHKKLIGVLDLDRVSSIPQERVRTEIGRVVERLLDDERVPMTTAEQNKIVEEVLDEVLGLGPLEPLLKEPSISDILVNSYDKVFIERQGRLQRSPVRFRNNAHLLHIIEKIVAQVGRRVDEAQPIVDARLKDGSRVNAIIPPLALDGPSLSIRRFGRHVITSDEMIGNQTIMPSMLQF